MGLNICGSETVLSIFDVDVFPSSVHNMITSSCSVMFLNTRGGGFALDASTTAVVFSLTVKRSSSFPDKIVMVYEGETVTQL